MKRHGFTLIEVIISVTIFTLIMLTVYSTFYMGMKAWQRGEEVGYLQKLRVIFLKMEKELNKSFFFSNIPFNGTAEEIVFPLIVSDEDNEKVAIITYSVKDNEEVLSKQIIRKEKEFSEENNEKEKTLLSSLRLVKFEYAYKTKGPGKDFEWRDNWDGKEQNALPSGVKVSLELDDSEDIYTKVIFIQQGRLGVQR